MGTTGNSEMSPSSSSEIIPTPAAIKSDSKEPQSSNATSSPEAVLTSTGGKSSGGPRTPEGKERSKHNALKHGIFSNVVLLKNDSKADYDALLTGLREHYQPEGTLEEVLVEKLATLTWRQRRVLVAEVAEIGNSREFLEWDRRRKEDIEAEKLARRDVTELDEALGRDDREGLIWHIENPVILNRCLELLEKVLEGVKSEGLLKNPEEVDSTLKQIYGSAQREHLMETLYAEYRAWRMTAEAKPKERERGGFASPEECKVIVIREIKAEIERLKNRQVESSAFESKRIELEALRQAVPDSPGFERLMRYETSLERQFDRTLSQLERIQRMRKGQNIPPPIKLDVATS